LLALSNGAPLKARALAPHFAALDEQMTGLLEALLDGRIDVTRASADMQGEGLSHRLDWVEAWLAGVLRRRTGLPDENSLTFRAGSPLQRVQAEVNITAAFQVLDRLAEARRLLEGSAAAPLVTENVLLDLRAALGSR
jgi:hypothetical protein